MFPNFLISLLIQTLVVLFILIVISIYRITFSGDYTTDTISLNELKSGDIIGVSGRNSNYFVNFVRAWSMSIWNHVGIIYVDDVGRKYVLEAAMYRDIGRELFKIPLDQWLYLNRKSKMAVSSINKEVNNKSLLEKFNIMKNYASLASYDWGWYRLAIKHVFNSKYQDHFTCTEIAVNVLQELGVIDSNTSCSSYFPGDIMMGRMDFVQGYYYEKARQLKSPYYLS